MRLLLLRTVLLFALVALSGCEPGDDRILNVDATGTVFGIVFLDRDGNRQPDAGVDGPVPGAGVTLLVRGTRQVVARVTADGSGGYLIPGVPVGSYSVALDSTVLGDSLRMLEVSPGEVTVARGDTVVVTIATGRVTVAVAAARGAAPGRRLALEGVALNSWSTFGDSTLHLADSTGAIRAVEVRFPGVSAGDSVRLFGEIGSDEGRPALVAPEVVVLGRARMRAPEAVSSRVAAAAAGGRLDAAAVRVAGAILVDAHATAAGDLRLQVDDGSGMLEVVVDRSAQITSELPMLPGARLDAVGLLTPRGDGSWRLKPRSTRDVTITVPTSSISQARSLAAGRLVSLQAVSLNGWSTFGDGNLHLADSTGSVLAVGVPASFVFAGDRVRLLGIVGVYNGRTAVLALASPRPAILGQGQIPAPLAATTGAAAQADGGRLDAALVRVSGATVGDTASLAGDFLLEVDDGSGPLEVMLEDQAGVSSSVHPPGAVLDVTGLLLPQPGGRRWILRPRSREDIVAR